MTAAATVPVIPRTPLKPFYFNTSAHVARITRYRATTLAELLDALRECPEASIFHHTFQTLEEHHFIPEGFSNDFAHWVLSDCNEPALAERLASVDVREFTSLDELRGRLVQIVGDFLQRNPANGQRTAQEPFYFCVADTVVLPTSFVAHSLPEFTEGLQRVSVHSIHHHFIEARLRIKLMSNDFSQWLLDVGLIEPARLLDRIDIYTATLEDIRAQILRIVRLALI
jgi:uncharacterized protein DUF5752